MKLMITSKTFIDSNILVYLFDYDERKRLIAEELVISRPNISAQIFVEVVNVCKKKFHFTKSNMLVLWNNLLRDCSLIPTDKQSFQKAIQLVNRYDFQLFDALIVADALKANCTILYSEDMQHKMLVENKLTIINPFL